MVRTYLPGDSITCQASFTNAQGQPVNPTTATLKIYNALGLLEDTVEWSDISNPTQGTIRYIFVIPADSPVGNWKYRFEAQLLDIPTVSEKYFVVVERALKTYCTIYDVYRKAGITSDVVIPEDVIDHILDSQSEIDEIMGRTFYNEQEVTEWIDTISTHSDESVRNREHYQIFLKYRPVQKIDSIELYSRKILDREILPDEYYFDPKIGMITLIKGYFPNQKQSVKVTYKYGYPQVPRNIKHLCTAMSALRILTEQVGTTYDDVTSYTLPTGVSVMIGQPYMNMTKAIEILRKEIDDLLSRIGRYRSNSVVI